MPCALEICAAIGKASAKMDMPESAPSAKVFFFIEREGKEVKKKDQSRREQPYAGNIKAALKLLNERYRRFWQKGRAERGPSSFPPQVAGPMLSCRVEKKQ